jgi:hypothetical protein
MTNVKNNRCIITWVSPYWEDNQHNIGNDEIRERVLLSE